MCGVAGSALRPGRRLSEDALRMAGTQLQHRGPDDRGLHLDHAAGVGLVHTRLSILDLSPLGHQPMVAPDGGAVITYNGEIYNFRTLRSGLQAKGLSFRSQSDTEVLLALYQMHGEAMLPMLDGIFAFALWDIKRKVLLLARDAFGVKPLYYAALADGVRFASEIKALRSLIPGELTLDVAALARYATFLWCPGVGTPVREVKKLPPGTLLRIRDGVAESPVAWSRLPVAGGARQDLTEQEAVSGVRNLLRTAVHRQMVSDVPVGAFLSGGLDSSAVVAFARECAADLKCFTIAPEGGADLAGGDDLPFARRVASHLGVSLEVVPIASDRMADELAGMVASLDEPLADPSALNVRYIARLARQAGVTVLLSGAGGDDVFTGYRRHAALSLDHWWRWTPASARLAVANWTSRLDQRRPSTRRLAKFFDGAALDGPSRLIRPFCWTAPSRVRELVSPAHQACVTEQVIEEPMRLFLDGLPDETTPLTRMLALEQRFFLADHNLLYTDKMGMAEGVETRVPFLDPALVAFAARIPDRLQQRGLSGKRILKAALSGILPDDVIHRQKVGFGAPVRRWLRGPLRPLVRDILTPATLARRGIFDPRAVAGMLDDDEAGSIDGAYLILSLVCIELWCQQFLDSAT